MLGAHDHNHSNETYSCIDMPIRYDSKNINEKYSDKKVLELIKNENFLHSLQR